MEQAAKRSTIRTTQFCLENTVAYTASTGTSSTCRETHVSLALRQWFKCRFWICGLPQCSVSRVVHRAFETEVFHPSSQTYSPASVLVTHSWTASAPPVFEKSPASLKKWCCVPGGNVQVLRQFASWVRDLHECKTYSSDCILVVSDWDNRTGNITPHRHLHRIHQITGCKIFTTRLWVQTADNHILFSYPLPIQVYNPSYGGCYRTDMF